MCHVPSCALLTTFLQQRAPGLQGRSLVNSTTRPSDQSLRVLLLLPQQLIHGEVTCYNVTPRVRVHLLGQDHCQEQAPMRVGWPELMSGSREERRCWGGEEGGTRVGGLPQAWPGTQWQPARAEPVCPTAVMGRNWSETRASLQWKFLRTFQTGPSYQAEWWDFPTEFFNFKGISANFNWYMSPSTITLSCP